MANDKWMNDFQELMVRQSVKTLTPSSTSKKSEAHVASFKLKEKYALTHQCFLECRLKAQVAAEEPENLENNAARIVVQFYDKDRDYAQKVYESFAKLPLETGLLLHKCESPNRIYITKQNLPVLDKTKPMAEQDAEVRLYCQACSTLERAWKACLSLSVALT